LIAWFLNGVVGENVRFLSNPCDSHPTKEEDFKMEIKKQKQEKKLVKTLPVTNLLLVSLNEKDMSAVSGGGKGVW